MSSIRSVLPPAFISWLNTSGFYPYGFKGRYKTWEEANRLSTGYNNEAIFKRVLDATLSVVNNEKAFDRDGVAFDKLECNWQLISAVLYAHSILNKKEKLKLNILDFGGALGSSYLQNRIFLEHIINSWQVIEQAPLVELANKHISIEQLDFETQIENIATKSNPTHVVLFSSVLQYLEHYQEYIKQALRLKPELVLIDRTSISKDDSNHVVLQKVSKKIYPASYPCWVISSRHLIELFKAHEYHCICEYNSHIDEELKNIEFKGYVFKRS